MSYHEGSNWQAKKEDENKPLYTPSPAKAEPFNYDLTKDSVTAIKTIILKHCSSEEMAFLKRWMDTYNLPAAPAKAEQEGLIAPIKVIEALVYYGQIHAVEGVWPAGMLRHKEAIVQGEKWLHENCVSINGEYQLKSTAPPVKGAEQEGPWRYEVHHEAGVAMTGCSGGEYVTITDGKVVLFADVEEGEEFDGEVALCNVLNRFKIKLDYNHEAEMVADFLEKELKRITDEKRESEGLRWVRITDAESLPLEDNSACPKKYAVRYQMSDSDGNNPEIGHDWLTASEVANECQGCDWFEYLAESQNNKP